MLEGLLEVTILAIGYYFVWRQGYAKELFPTYFGYGKYVLAGVYAVLLLVMFFGFDGFKFGYLRISDALLSQWMAIVIANFITYWQLCLIANTVISPVPILVLTAGAGAVALLCVVFYTWLYHRLYVPKNMVMILGNDSAVSLKFKMETRPDKYRVDKVISIEEGLERICAQIVNYDAVIINDVPSQIRNDILKFCYEKKLRTYITPKITDIVIRGATSINLFDTPLLLTKGGGLTPVQRLIKRTIDFVISLVAMIIASPVMLLAAIAIKLEDGGPVFFKQERVTQDGRLFNILKFRSMIVNAEKKGEPQMAAVRDPRITKVGRIIRATRIDELPQILNILKGDMSIVGPRPERQSYIDKFCKETPEFVYRLKVKGGLTGYAQIYGKYNTSPYDKLRMDLMYVEKYSLLLDIKLMLMTLRILMKRESTEGFAEQPKNAKEAESILKEMHKTTEKERKKSKTGSSR